jgi:hypothetical protein
MEGLTVICKRGAKVKSTHPLSSWHIATWGMRFLATWLSLGARWCKPASTFIFLIFCLQAHGGNFLIICFSLFSYLLFYNFFVYELSDFFWFYAFVSLWSFCRSNKMAQWRQRLFDEIAQVLENKIEANLCLLHYYWRYQILRGKQEGSMGVPSEVIDQM